MNDLPEPDHQTADTETSTLQAFLSRKGAALSCPSCGQNTWTIVETPGQTAAVPLFQNNGGWVSPPAHVPAYVLICNNCAFIRMHAKLIVEANP